MRLQNIHSWDIERGELADLQRTLSRRLIEKPLAASPKIVAGVDISYNRGDKYFFASAVALSMTNLSIVEISNARTKVEFPYIPGFLSFREGPPALAALGKLKVEPDVIICDGQGRAHPRRFGLACHLGLFCNRPTIGAAKSVLLGRFVPPEQSRGSQSKMYDGEEIIGIALRTRNRVEPIYVSTGHLIDLESATKLLLDCGAGYRLPEPSRQAHLAVNEFRRTYSN